MVDQLIALAEKQVGYLEKASNSQLDSFTANAGYNNWTKYGRDYDSFMGTKLNGQPWCAMFCTWLAIQLGVSLDDYYHHAYCPYGVTWYKNKGWWHTTPQVGDMIYFKNSSGVASHIGIVYKVDSSYVYTIEGNTSGTAGVVANGGGVFKKSYSRGYSSIMGYGRPNYSAATNDPDEFGCIYPEPTYILRKGSTGNGVSWAQFMLTFCGYDIGPAGIDGDFETSTLSAAVKFQTDHGLESDGEIGELTRAALKKAAKHIKEDELTVSQYNEIMTLLREIQTAQEAQADLLMPKYMKVSDIPAWGQEAVQDAMDRGILRGVEDGNLGLSWAEVRSIVLDYRRETA